MSENTPRYDPRTSTLTYRWDDATALHSMEYDARHRVFICPPVQVAPVDERLLPANVNRAAVRARQELKR